MNHVLCGLAANPALPSELVDRLIAIADADLAADLAGRADLSRGQALALAARVEESAVQLAYRGRLSAEDVDPAAQPDAALALLDEGAGEPEWGRRLVADPEVRRREKLAGCPDLPAEVVRALAADPDVRVVAELALWTTAERAAELAEHPHAEVRRAVAANEATPPAVLARLIGGEGMAPAERCVVCDREQTPFAHDPHCPRLDCDLPPGAACDGSHESTVHHLREAALRNPATPVAAVVGFADHPSALLRRTLAARADLPPEVAARLALDPVPGVRAALAENPALDEATLRTLADDAHQDVRRSLAHNPHVPFDVLVRPAAGTKLGATLLPRVEAASAAEVAELAQSPSAPVRMLVAHRRDLPARIRDALADDSDARVVKSVAAHPGLSDGQLRAMVRRYGVQVVAKVAANPDAAPALLEDLTRHQPAVRKAFREIARHRRATAPALLACLADVQARPVAAGHPALPPPVLVELLTDTDRRVAEAAAANPSLPPGVMLELVRWAASAGE
ncbi:hypothetical protein [Streptomyces sp. TRM68416]|uniref:hypothetical protein n=1 Tax=Streptomyces sp. TRM68416 TaxID=2758412 RepID=UPI001661B1F2|nr:hypothetical protein [Streptomyces sp. TRM68416]MBD0841454.1 hypothetical protein [Streptomyces sp. TRM68416]